MKQVVQIIDPDHKWCGALGVVEDDIGADNLLITFHVLNQNSFSMAYASFHKSQLAVVGDDSTDISLTGQILR